MHRAEVARARRHEAGFVTLMLVLVLLSVSSLVLLGSYDRTLAALLRYTTLPID